MSSALATRWCVVQTHPRAETKAAAHLSRQGFLTYLPRIRKSRRHARCVEMVEAPLFPRYLFVALDIAKQPWRCVQSTVGVARLVCNGDAPAFVGDDVVQELRGREDGQGFVKLRPHLTLRQGAQVRLQVAPFGDCPGRFDGLTEGERVAVLLDLLGRKVRVIVDSEWVAAA